MRDSHELLIALREALKPTTITYGHGDFGRGYELGMDPLYNKENVQLMTEIDKYLGNQPCQP